MNSKRVAIWSALIGVAMIPLVAGGQSGPDPGKIVNEVREGNAARDAAREAERAKQTTNNEVRINALAEQKAKAMTAAATQPSTDRITQLETELARTKADLVEARAAVVGLTAERDALRRQVRGEK